MPATKSPRARGAARRASVRGWSGSAPSVARPSASTDRSYSRSVRGVANRDPTFAASVSLLLLHVVSAALDGARPSLGHHHLRAALRTRVNLPDLVRHGDTVLLSTAESRRPTLEETTDSFA